MNSLSFFLGLTWNHSGWIVVYVSWNDFDLLCGMGGSTHIKSTLENDIVTL